MCTINNICFDDWNTTTKSYCFMAVHTYKVVIKDVSMICFDNRVQSSQKWVAKVSWFKIMQFV